MELAGLSWLEPVTAELQPRPKGGPGARPEGVMAEKGFALLADGEGVFLPLLDCLITFGL